LFIIAKEIVEEVVSQSAIIISEQIIQGNIVGVRERDGKLAHFFEVN